VRSSGFRGATGVAHNCYRAGEGEETKYVMFKDGATSGMR
jgi:hypothetical protein